MCSIRHKKNAPPLSLCIFFEGSKDAEAGMNCWAEVLDANLDPLEEGVSVLKRLLPNVKHLILSGDTGNGK